MVWLWKLWKPCTRSNAYNTEFMDTYPAFLLILAHTYATYTACLWDLWVSKSQESHFAANDQGLEKLIGLRIWLVFYISCIYIQLLSYFDCGSSHACFEVRGCGRLSSVRQWARSAHLCFGLWQESCVCGYTSECNVVHLKFHLQHKMPLLHTWYLVCRSGIYYIFVIPC